MSFYWVFSGPIYLTNNFEPTQKGVITGDGLVTPAFLLHLATSDATGPSEIIPDL